MLNYFKGRSTIWFLRLGIGLLIMGQGILVKDYLFTFLGVWMAAMPLLNIGCGSTTSSCASPIEPIDQKEIEEVKYEEIT